MEHTCQDCSRRFFVPGAGVQEVACPGCGGHMEPERDQPSGVNSDGDLRNMVDPYTGVDAGGSPDTEGILGGDHTQPLYKRDESFASVRTAAQQGQATPSMPAGIHNGTLPSLGFVGATINGMPPNGDLYKWTITEWLPAAKQGNVMPVTVEVQNDHPAYLAAAIAIVNNSSACMGKRVPVPEFKTLVMGIQSGEIPPPQKQARIAGPMDDFDMGDWGFGDDDGAGPTHKFIVDGQGTVYSLPEPTHHEEVAQKAGLDMTNFPRGLSLGHLNADGSTEWYQHQSGMQPQQMAQALEHHFQMPVTIDPSLKPSSSEERFGITPGARGNGKGELEIAQGPPNLRQRGMPLDRNEGLVRGGHLDQTIHLPYEHIATEKEALGIGDIGKGIGGVAQGIGDYAVHHPVDAALTAAMFVPGIGTAAGLAGKAALMGGRAAMAGKVMKGGMAAEKGAAGAGLASKLMGGAKSVGKAMMFNNIAKGITGGGKGQASEPAPSPVTAPTLQQVTHVLADTETPSSVPALHENDGDTMEHSDGDNRNPEHDDSQSGSGHDSPAGELLEHLWPLAMSYYLHDESGADDPLMISLDAALEKEFPGYKDQDDGDHSDVEDFIQKFMENQGDDKKEGRVAAPPFHPGMGYVPQAPSPGVGNAVVPPMPPAAAGPNPAGNVCPSCGAQLNPDGSCAQCGFGAENQTTPGQVNQAVTPGTSVGGPSTPPQQMMGRVADTQGPYTPEQFKIVAEYLLQAGRQDEIPHMYDAPYEYADILAELQNKLNAPPPAVEAPAAPPAAPGMDPSMMDPSAAPPGGPPSPGMMTARIASATARYANGNIAFTSPMRDSGAAEIFEKQAEIAEHPHDQPILEHHDLTDGAPAPHPDDNDLTWTTPDGQPLTEGQEYEMHSDEYSIPDVIRVEQVKSGELVYTITGEYSELEDTNTITPEEVEQRGIKFLPVGGEQPVEDAPESTEPTATSRVPITTNVLAHEQAIDVELADGRVVAAKIIGGKLIIPKTAWQQVDDGILVADPGDRANGATVVEVDNLSHHLDDGRILPAEEVRPEPPKEAAWLLEGTNISAVPAPWENELPDLTGGSLEQIVAGEPQGTDRDWLVADLPRTAGAKFSPSEQRTFIEEQGEARNLDRLDLEDTHYKTRETSVYVAGRNEYRHARPDTAPDDHLVFGL